MFRLSAIRNYPLICRKKRVGLLQDIGVNLESKEVTEWIVGCGFYGKRRILSDYIRSVSDGFVLLEDHAKCMAARDCVKTEFVFDTSGLLLGRVTDYMIDESTKCIQALEVITGYWPCRYTRRIWLFAYEYRGKGEILVPASIGSELIGIKREEERCV